MILQYIGLGGLFLGLGAGLLFGILLGKKF